MRGGKPLRTLIRILAIILILFIIGMVYSIFEKEQSDSGQNGIDLENKTLNTPSEQEMSERIKIEGLFKLIGEDSSKVKDQFGDPNRIDPSSFGYHWWIYNDNNKKYVQIGIENDKVVTFFVMGERLNIKPFKIGQSVADIYSSYFIPSDIQLKYEGQEYLFELSEEDVNIRPIIKLEHFYVQLYIDKFTGTLSSIRAMDAPTLIKLKPFDYREEYIETPMEKYELDRALGKALQKQIFDLTNVLRDRYRMRSLKWDERLSKSAFERSVELHKEDQQSIDKEYQHEQISPMKDQQMFIYFLDGENVAIPELDAPAIVESWFNSAVHRQNILSENFRETGIGIYSEYLVQKFSPNDLEEVQ
ncbi:CAP-associated domain-containing protein [Niallia sp. XMNu-256]|uniref:CAP domain-containing protein n=1 Tax=Niallia sp. XMNu-256 TaxID=3082444 RepID=UPI0030CD09BD